MIWDTETGDYLRSVQPDSDSELCSILYINGGRRIASISLLHSETCIRVWDTSTGDCLLRKCFAAKFCGGLGTGAARTSVSVSSYNDGMVACPRFEKTIEMWDLGRCEQLSTIVHPYNFAGISISSDGEHLAIVSDQGTIRLQSFTNLLRQQSTVNYQTRLPIFLASLVSSMLNWKQATLSNLVPPTTDSVNLVVSTRSTTFGRELSYTPLTSQDPTQSTGPNPICGVEFSIRWDFMRFRVWPHLKFRRIQDMYETTGT